MTNVNTTNTNQFKLYGLSRYTSVKIVFLGEGETLNGLPLVKFELSASSDELRAVIAQLFFGSTSAELNDMPISVRANSITWLDSQKTVEVIAEFRSQ